MLTCIKKYNKHLKKNFKRFLAVVLVGSMLWEYVPTGVFAVPESQKDSPTLTSTIYVEEGDGVTKLENGNKYMLENGAEAYITVSIAAQNFTSSDTLNNIFSKVKLGYFDENNNEVDADKGYGGVVARVVNDNEYWVDKEYVNSHPDSDLLTDPEKDFKGELSLDFNSMKTFEAGKTYTYTIAVSFMSDTQENAVFNLKTYAGYDGWDYEDSDGQIIHNDIKFVSQDTDASQTLLVNSNLKWETDVEVISGPQMTPDAPVMWQEYNYQTVLITIKNVSEKDTAYFDAFEHIFRLQYDNDINGVSNTQMTSWFYNPDDPDNPIENENPGDDDKSRLYVGKLNQGGLMVYDVTGVDREQFDDPTSLGKPLPYSYTLNGQGTVKVTKTLYAPAAAEADPNKDSEMQLLLMIPFPNMFEFTNGYAPVNNRYSSTVFFGKPEVSISNKETLTTQYFQSPEVDASVNKTAQTDQMFVGQKGYYTINNITNKSNLPVFNPSVIDILPQTFDLTDFKYVVDSSDVDDLSAFDLSDVLDVQNPVEAEIKDKNSEKTSWIPLGTFTEETSQNPDERIWGLNDVDTVLAQYAQLTSDEEFTGRVRINYAYSFDNYIELDEKLDIDEVIPGDLRVVGIPRKAITIKNDAELYVDYWRYKVSGVSSNGEWSGVETGPYNATASKNVTPPDLWVMTNGLYDDGTTRIEEDTTTGTINSLANGYTVRFGIDNESDLTSGRLTIELPYSKNSPNRYIGFDTDQIKITKELLSNIKIKNIVFTLYSGNEVTLPWEDAQKYIDNVSGDLIFTSDSQVWYYKNDIGSFPKDELAKRNKPIKIVINLDHVNSSTVKQDPIENDPAYIQFLGLYQYPGLLTAKTTFESQYLDGEQEEIQTTDDGSLQFELPTLEVQTDAIYDNKGYITEGDSVTSILNKDVSGYRLKIAASVTSISPGFASLELPNTFNATQILISSEFLDNITEDEKRTYTKLTITGTQNTVLEISDEELDKLINLDGDIVIPQSYWVSNSKWQKSEEIKNVKLNFNFYRKDTSSINKDTAFIEVKGIATRVLNHVATGLVSTDYIVGSGNTNVSLSDNATIVIPKPEINLIAQGAVINGDTRSEGNPAYASVNQEDVGYTFRVGSSNITRIEPGYLSVSIPVTAKGEYIASDITLTKEMLNRMKLTSIVITALTGEKTTLTLEDLGVTWQPDAGSDYMTFSDDIVIESDRWQGVAKTIIVYFDYYESNLTVEANDTAYMQVLGSAYIEGTLNANATLSTAYPDLGDTYRTYVNATGQLQIETIIPTVEALSHNVNTLDEPNRKIDEQHAQNIVIPNGWDTYYTYDFGNDAKSAKIVDSKVTITFNNRVRKPSDEIYGFDISKLEFSSNYNEVFEADGKIESIKIYDVDTSIVKELTMDDFKKDSEGKYYLEKSSWSDTVTRPSKIEFIFKNFKNNITGDDRLRLTAYGTVDWYTYITNDDPAYKHDPSTWEKLRTDVKFESLGLASNKSDTSYATQDVPIPATSLSVDYQNYYENAQGKESKGMPTLSASDAVAYVDGTRSYLATPYEKTLTYQFSLFQPSISYSDQFFVKADIPLNSSSDASEAKRGFHAETLVVNKDIFDGTYFKDFKMTLVDANDSNRKIYIEWDNGSLKLTDTSSQTSVLSFDENDNLTLTRDQWEKAGIEAIGEFYIEGDGFITRPKDEDGDIYLTGFSDSNFADNSYSGGHNDIVTTYADSYLKNLNIQSGNEYPYVARRIDQGRHLISKMYFDYQLETGFITDNDTDTRYIQTGISAEHIRNSHNYPAPGHSDYLGYNYSYFNDVGFISTGYKSLSSITVDFRQYLYDYTNKGDLYMPNNSQNGHSAYIPSSPATSENADYAADDNANNTPFDYDGNKYVKKYAYNTTADLALTINVPKDQGFDAYYLKIDPRAVIGTHGQKYINKIEVYREDGNMQTVDGSSLTANSAKWNDATKSKTWYRLNLVTQNSDELFMTEEEYREVGADNPYYRTPDQGMSDNPVTKVVIYVSINQNESFDGQTAADPDFGSWVEDTVDMNDQHMFEIVGRSTKTGTLTPTATAKITVGGREIDSQGTSSEMRSTDGTNVTGTSPWSLKNYYRQWYRYTYNGSYRWTYNLLEYTAGHLSSSSKIEVEEKSALDTKHGIEDSLYYQYYYNSNDHTYETSKYVTDQNYKIDYLYGREKAYNITIFRRANPGSIKGDDAVAYESYIDNATFVDTMPPLTGNYNTPNGYKGFRPTKLLLKTDLLEHATNLEVSFKDGSTKTYTADDFKGASKITEGGIDYYAINIYYNDDPNHTTLIANKSKNDIVIMPDGDNANVITKYSIYMEDIVGNGDYASDIYGKEKDTYFANNADSANTKLIKLYGNINVINGQEVNGADDGINYTDISVKNDGGNPNGTGNWSPHSPRPALMKAFAVPLEASSTLNYEGGTGELWDYDISTDEKGTEVAVNPFVSNYSLNFRNSGEINLPLNGDTGTYDESVIDSIAFTQSLPAQFRLTTVRLPSELFETNKVLLTEFSVNDGTKDVNVFDRFVDKGDYYELDLASLFKDGTLTRTEYSRDGVTYSAEKIVSFSGKFVATNKDTTNLDGYLKPTEELLASKNDIDFSGIWVDRTIDDINSGTWGDDSTPTIGMNAHTYNSTITFPARTITVTTPQKGTTAQRIEENNTLTQIIYNRVSGLKFDVQRGSVVSSQNTIGYDEYSKADREENPVAVNGLYPGDRVEYLLTVTASNIADDTPLKNPIIRFVAPTGTRIVGWKFVEASDPQTDVAEEQQIVSADDLTANAYLSGVGTLPTELTDGQIYHLDSENQKYNYKELVISPKSDIDRYVGNGSSYKVIVYLEMLNEYADTFEGKVTTENIYVSAGETHNYDSYYVFNRSGTTTSSTSDDIDGTTATSMRSDMVDADKDNFKELGLVASNTLTYYTDSQNPSVDIVYPNGYDRDYEDVNITVGNIKNYPKHYQDYMVMDINFVKETGAGAGKQYFYLTELPKIKYQVSNSEAGKDGVFSEVNGGTTKYYRYAKLYYKTDDTVIPPTSSTDVTGGWKELTQNLLDQQEDAKAFLESIQQIRWIYEDVPAFLNNDGTTVVSMDDAVFKGYAEYQDERTNPETEANVYKSTMQINVDETFIHVHEEDPLDESVVFRSNVGTAYVKRLRPKVEINLQAFNTEIDADAAYTASPTNLKMGYRPSETFWYKLVVNNIASDEELGNGPLLNPIIYDKVPTEYLDFDGQYKILVYNSDGTSDDFTQKLTDAGAITSTEIQAMDIGGSQSFQYVDTVQGDAQPIDIVRNPTYNPNDDSSSTIKYTVYKIDFGKLNFKLESGQRIEIIYDVTVHDTGLPLTKWIEAEDENGLDVNGQTAYLPRYGEYANNGYSAVTPTASSVSSKMMDMDNLIHEFGVTGDLNHGTDPLEFLNGSTSYIPGASKNTKPSYDWDGYWKNNTGSNIDVTDKFFGANLNSSSKQKVTIGMGNGGAGNSYPSSNTVYANYNATANTNGITFAGSLSGPRSYYTYLMSARVANITTARDTLNIDPDGNSWKDAFIDETEQNIIWAQHNLHMQKAWVSSASEMVSSEGNKYYENGTDVTEKRLTYHNSGSYNDGLYDQYAYEDNNTPALEYGESFISRLYALNYGDWDVNGLEFTYVFPKGVEPQFDADGNLNITVRSYNGTTLAANATQHQNHNSTQMTDASQWTTLGADVTYEIIQDPTKDEELTTPSNSLVDVRRNASGESRYNVDDVEGCWVIKITVNENLSKWWNRGSQNGYIMALDVPSFIYEDTMEGYWYDRLYVAPVDNANNAYYQIYDTTYQLDKTYGSDTTERFDIDLGGMNDYYKCTTYDSSYRPYSLIAPPMMYLDGYNIQSNAVNGKEDSGILISNNKYAVDNSDIRQYAQSGNQAVSREPFVRLWGDIGERDENGVLDESNFYVDLETEAYKVNANLENRYYAAEYPYNFRYNTAKSSVNYSYNLADGGARGTLFDPVFTIVLPYGTMPLNSDGEVFSATKDGTPLNGKNDTTDAVSWELYVSEWYASENTSQGNNQNMHAVSDENAAAQNLTKDNFTVNVTFDENTKQYIVKFIPKETTDPSTVKALKNQQMMKVSIDAVSYDYTENAPVNGDSYNQGYDQVEVYLSSNHDVFRYTADNLLSSPSKTANNPYQVLSKRIMNTLSNGDTKYSAFTVDPRLDSVRYVNDDRTWIQNNIPGTYAGQFLGKTEVRNADDYALRFPMKQTDYNEVDLATLKSAIKSLIKTDGDVTYADMNWDDGYMYSHVAEKDTIENGAIADVGVRNAFKFAMKNVQLISGAKFAYDKEDKGVTDGDLASPLDYADDVWYFLEFENRPQDVQIEGIFDAQAQTNRPDASKDGKINHATYTLTTYLPESLRYDDTFASSDDDKYADYSIEMYDANGDVVCEYDMDQLKESGWKVEVKSFPMDENNPDGRQYVRALIVPAGIDGTTPSNVHQPDKRAPGQLKDGERIVLKLKTRVAELDYLEDQSTFNEEDSTELFVNLHGLDGSEISIEDLSVITDGLYSEQSLKYIVYENRLKDEPIRVDDTNDYDFDGVTGGEEPEKYSYDKTGKFSISVPEISVRTNTIRIRRVLSPEPVTGEIPSRDAVYKLFESQDMLINQAVQENGAVNRFVVQFDVPYRSKLEPSPDVAVAPDSRVEVYVNELSTGKWEVPEHVEDKEELDENLRVYLYVRYDDGNENYTNIIDNPAGDGNGVWKLINPGGNKISDNQVYDIPNPSKVTQAIWVIEHTYDPEHYPVPQGFRLDVDADEDTADVKENVNDVDPPLKNTSEGLHEFEFSQSVLDNSIKVSIMTSLVDDKTNAQYLNYYASAWSKYSDTKESKIGKSYRAGYQVSPELPYMDLYSNLKYLQYSNSQKKYTWDDSLLLDLSSSRILKYKFELFNVNQELIDQYDPYGGEEDILSNPNITVALPYRENIVSSNFDYVPFNEIGSTPLDESYTALNASDVRAIQKDLKWTAYVVDEDGTKYPLNDTDIDDPTAKIQLSLDGDLIFNRKSVDVGNDRNTITFNFKGRLMPGQRVVIEYLSCVEDGLVSSNPEDMQTKVFGIKDGNFLAARLPTVSVGDDGEPEYTDSQVGVRSDSYDVNNNTNRNELALELSSQVVGFKTQKLLEQKKRVSTDLNSTNNESTIPIAVQEGGIYHFTSAVQSLNNPGIKDYMAPVLFDILPYKGDEVITGSYEGGQYVANSRNSEWNGWIIPDSIKLYALGVQNSDTEMTYYEVNKDTYDIYVGPITKDGNGYKLLLDEDGNPILPDVNYRSVSDFYADINSNAQGNALQTEFVKLSELKNSNPENYEELIKGIRTLMVVFKDPADMVLYGSGRYELQYDMQAPLNLPIYQGDITVDTNKDEYSDFVGWNTMASAVLNYNDSGNLSGDGVYYIITDSNMAGVLLDAPSERGYIGDYVWYDENANGEQDEAKYERLVNGSRNILSEYTNDFDGDGQLDDPGINNVVVELLTEKGYPANVDGQAVAPNPDASQGGYFVIDEETGEYALTIDGNHIWTDKGPAVTTTTKDYYGNSGYYIFSNLAPGNYKLRFTMPSDYNNFALTTTEMYEKEISIYNPGDTLPKLNTNLDVSGNGTKVTDLTFISDVIEVDAVDLSSDDAFIEYDKNAVKADIGVGRPVRYGGTVWNDADENVSADFHYNGLLDNEEAQSGISDVEVYAYEKGSDTVAIGMDNRPLKTVTDANGNYEFTSLWPNREYEFKILNTIVNGIPYKSTPVYIANDPLEHDNDNDGVSEQIDDTIIVKVASFKAEYMRNQSGQLILDPSDNSKVMLNSSIDIGFVEPGSGTIGDYIWIDENENGIQDENELSYSEELTLTLEPWYYDADNKGWNKLPDGIIDESLLTTKSQSSGHYSFVKLPGVFRYYYDADGNEVDENSPNVAGSKNYIIGYRLKLEALPNDYNYTQVKQGNDSALDSDLYDDAYLTLPGEYIVVATESSSSKPSTNTEKVVMNINGEEITKYYRVDSNEFLMDYDIGLVKTKAGTVSGRVWEDYNQDGVQDPQTERAVSGVKVYLERKLDGNNYLDSKPVESEDYWTANEHITVNEDGYLVTDKVAPETTSTVQQPTITDEGQYMVVAQTVTDENGEYIFDNLPTYSLVNPFTTLTDEKNSPIRYRIRIEKPINSDLTAMDANQNANDDSDSDFGILEATSNPLTAVSETFVLGKRMYEDETQQDGFGNQYDFTKYNVRTHIDAGLVTYTPYAEIGDYVWDDHDKDGVQDDSENGIPGIKVVLYRFNPDIVSDVYILDEDNTAIGTQQISGKWEEYKDEDGNLVETVTDENGKYTFKVVAYDNDPASPHYLEPYHYRAMIYYDGDGEFSPMLQGSEITLDSNGYNSLDILDPNVKLTEVQPEELGEDGQTLAEPGEDGQTPTDPGTGEDDTKPGEPEYEVVIPEYDENAVSPFDTPVGNIYGITLSENTMISKEFDIASVYVLNNDFSSNKELELKVFEQINTGVKAEKASNAQYTVIDQSQKFFDDSQVQTFNDDSSQDDNLKVIEKEYVDFRLVNSDYTVDFGITLPEEPEEPDPEEPEKPDPEDPDPEEPEKPDPEEPDKPTPEEPDESTPEPDPESKPVVEPQPTPEEQPDSNGVDTGDSIGTLIAACALLVLSFAVVFVLVVKRKKYKH